MKKIIFIVFFALIPVFAQASMGKNDFSVPVSNADTLENETTESYELRLTPELMEEIISSVNDNYVASKNMKHKKESDVFATISFFYDGIYNSIIKCNEQELYTDAECVINNLTDFRDELKNSARTTYSGLISDANSKEEKISTDFYLINYYYFMSMVYSECSIKNLQKRLDCLGNIQFLEVQITSVKLDWENKNPQKNGDFCFF